MQPCFVWGSWRHRQGQGFQARGKHPVWTAFISPQGEAYSIGTVWCILHREAALSWLISQFFIENNRLVFCVLFSFAHCHDLGNNYQQLTIDFSSYFSRIVPKVGMFLLCFCNQSSSRFMFFIYVARICGNLLPRTLIWNTSVSFFIWIMVNISAVFFSGLL